LVVFDPASFETDPEFILLAAGHKRLVKKECVSVDDVDGLRQAAERRGWRVGTPAGVAYDGGRRDDIAYDRAGGLTTVIVGVDAESVAAGLECLATELDRSATRSQQADAMRRFGQLLGYPDCCIDAYQQGPSSPFFERGTGGFYLDAYHRTLGPFEPLLNRFALEQSYISHSPCTYNCAESTRLAGVVHAALEARSPERARRNRERMERAVLWWGQDRQIALEGEWRGGVFHYRTVDTRLGGDPLAPAVKRAMQSFFDAVRKGNQLTYTLGRAAVRRDGKTIACAADLTPLDPAFLFDFTGGWHPYDRSPRLALLDLQTAGDNFFANDIPLLAGDLLRLGVPIEMYWVHLGHSDDRDARSRFDRLLQDLTAAEVSTVVAARAISSDLLREIGEAGISRVFFYSEGREDGTVDAVLDQWARRDHLGPYNDGGRASRVRAMLCYLDEHYGPEREGRRELPNEGAIRADVSPLEAPFAPLLRWTGITGEKRPEPNTWFLRANEGCPYKTEYGESGAEYLEGQRELTLKGCNFCRVGGNYNQVGDRDQLTDALADQIAHVRQRAPHVERFIIGDTYPTPYLALLLEKLAERRVSHCQILAQARPDWFLKIAARLEGLIPSLEERNIQLVFYLIGFENFSQDELDRMDKGLTVEQNLETIERLNAFERAHPKAFSARRYTSHGFILFNPWTTIDDLAKNAEITEQIEFYRFKSHFLLTRTRLYPYLPIFHKAKSEGLLIERYLDSQRSSARRVGYSPEYPWRSPDARVELVFDLVASLHDNVQPRQHSRLLGEAVAIAREQSTESAPDKAAFDALLASLRERMRKPG